MVRTSTMNILHASPTAAYHRKMRPVPLPDFNVFITLLMSVVGAGMLSVPYAFLLLPLWQALLCILMVGLTMLCTATALVYAHAALAQKEERLMHVGVGQKYASFQSIAIQAGGDKAGRVVSILTGFGIFGGCVGGIRIVRDLTPNMLLHLGKLFSDHEKSESDLQVAGDIMVWALFIILVLPLCMMKSISGLRIVSYLSFVCSMYLVGAIVYRSYYAVDTADPVNPSPVMEAHHSDRSYLSRFSQSISIYNFAFMMHLNILPLFVQLRGNFAEPLIVSRARMTECITGVVIFVIVLYATLGFFASELYGDAINGNVLLNLRIDPMMRIPVVAVYLTVIFTFPMLFHPLRTVVEEFMQVQTKTFHRIAIASTLLIIELVVAMCVPGIEVVFTLTGATSCLLICFVFPLFAFTKLVPWRQHPWVRLGLYLLWIIVAFLCVIAAIAVVLLFI